MVFFQEAQEIFLFCQHTSSKFSKLSPIVQFKEQEYWISYT